MIDVASEHSGYQAEAKIGTGLTLGAMGLDLGAGVRLRDDKLNDFLYGVSATEANASRAAYDIGSTAEPFVGMTMFYAVTDRATLVGTVDHQFVDKDVRNSPLTTDNDRYGVGFGLLYSFGLPSNKKGADHSALLHCFKLRPVIVCRARDQRTAQSCEQRTCGPDGPRDSPERNPSKEGP